MDKSTKIIALIVILALAGLGIWWFLSAGGEVATPPAGEPVVETVE